MIRNIPFNAVQKAIYELLSKGQNVPVYSSITTGREAFPYIYLGAFEGQPVNENKTLVQHVISQTLDVWSTSKGKAEVNAIMDDAAYLLTKYNLQVEGYRQVGTADITNYQVIGERYENGISAYHGVLIARYIIEQI